MKNQECLFVGGPWHFTWRRVEWLGLPVEVPAGEEYRGENHLREPNTVYYPLHWTSPSFMRDQVIFYDQSLSLQELRGMEQEIQRRLDAKKAVATA